MSRAVKEAEGSAFATAPLELRFLLTRAVRVKYFPDEAPPLFESTFSLLWMETSVVCSEEVLPEEWVQSGVLPKHGDGFRCVPVTGFDGIVRAHPSLAGT